jgi:transcriptional regulator with GAF, ATPase, and Fis domain
LVWRVKLVTELEAGETTEIEVARIERDEQASLGDLGLRDNLNRLERSLLMEADRRSNGVRREAARLLGIDARNLAYYFRKHGLDPGAVAE